MDEYLESLDEDMQAALEALARDLAKVRTGRATPKLVDGVQVLVQSYGTSMPLNQLATVQAPEIRRRPSVPTGVSSKVVVGDSEESGEAQQQLLAALQAAERLLALRYGRSRGVESALVWLGLAVFPAS